MAENPDVFAPTVAPQEQAPRDTIQVQTNPGQFGGLIAQGAEKLGEGTSQGAQYWGQVQTDHSANDSLQRLSDLTEGVKNLKGQDALDAQKSTMTQAQQIIADGRKALNTPVQQLAYDNATRNMWFRYFQPQLNNHFNQQGQEVAFSTNEGGLKQTAGFVPAVADNPDQVEALADRARDFAVNSAHSRYGLDLTDALHDQAVARANQMIYGAQVQALAVKNPAMAQTVLESHKDDLGDSYAPLAEHLQSRADYDTGVQAGQAAIARAGQGFVGGGAPGGVMAPGGATPIPNAAPQPQGGPTPQANAFLRVLGAGEARSYNATYDGTPTGGQVADLSQFPHTAGAQGPAGPSHAAGLYQFEPATWQQQQQQTGVTDFSPQSQDKAAWNLASTTYSQNTNGRSLQTDLASGQTGLIPDALRTQWPSLNANSVTRLNSELQTVSAGGGNLPSAAFKASAYDQLMQDPALRNNPRAFQHALAYVNEQATAASVASMQNEKARKEASDAAGNAIITDALNGKTDGLTARIANDPALDWQSKIHLSQSIEGMLQKETGKDTQTYGPGFWDFYSKMHLPDGDPNKITDLKDLYAQGPSGNLTIAGIKELSGELAAKGTPEGEAESSMKRTFLTAARSEITGASAHMGIQDPKGDEQFLKFQAQFWPQYEAGRAAGKAPADLLDPASKDYLGKAIGQFKRPDSAWAADIAVTNNSATAPPMELKTPDDVASAVKGGKIGYVEGVQRLRALGYRSASETDPVPLAH